SFDDPVSKFFPDLKDIPINGSEAKGNPTIRNCYSQTSGIPQYVDRQFILVPGSTLAEGAVRWSQAKPTLSFAPGSHYQYGNASMSIAAACAERAIGKPFRQLLDERMLRPLGMTETTFSPGEALKPRISNRYEKGTDGEMKKFAGPPPGPIET